MRRYDSYKDSGIEWIGEIPGRWKIKKIKYVASINDEVLSEKTEEDFEMEYVDISSIESNVGIVKTENLKFKEAPSRARRLVKDGDIIVSTVRTYLKAITKIENPKPNMVVSTGFAVIRSRYVVSDFMGHLFYHENLLGEIISRSVGVSYPAINSLEIGTISIPLPSFEEQTAIATYLDRRTTEIDELIAHKKRLIGLYEEEKTAIINQAVTKGINPDVPMKESGIEWLGEIPEPWEIKRLKYIIKGFESGVSVNSLDNPIVGNEFGILKTSCVYDYTFRPDENKVILNKEELDRARTNPKKGMILISRMNTPELVGASGYVDRDYPNLFLPDRLWQTVLHPHITIDSKWLSFVLKSINFRKLLSTLATGTSPSMKNIGQEDVLNIPIPFPDITVQRLIVYHIETHCVLIDAKKSKTEKLIELLTEYRTALISEVVTGKIKVMTTP